MKSHPLSRLWGLIALLLVAAAYCIAEEITLPTYYPSPRGVYQELRSTSNTVLAFPAGSVGIGTNAPTATLEVAGGPIRIATDGMILATNGNPAGLREGQLWLVRNVQPGTTPTDIDSGLRIHEQNGAQTRTVEIATDPNSPLRLWRNNAVVGIALVDPANRRASKARIWVSNGAGGMIVRALRRRLPFLGQLFLFGGGGGVTRIDPDGRRFPLGSVGPGEDFGAGYDADKELLYAVPEGGTLYEFDPATGASKNLGPLQDAAGNVVYISDPGMAYDPNTQTMYLSSESNDGTWTPILYTLDTTTGIVTPIGHMTGLSQNIAGGGNTGLAFDSSTDTLYGVIAYAFNATQRLSDLYTVNTTTGRVTMLTSLPSTQATGLAFHNNNHLLYVSDSAPLNPAVTYVDPDTGQEYTTGNDFDGTVYTVDPLTREMTVVGAGSTEVEGIDFR